MTANFSIKALELFSVLENKLCLRFQVPSLIILSPLENLNEGNYLILRDDSAHLHLLLLVPRYQ
jgi:hypothetical protein